MPTAASRLASLSAAPARRIGPIPHLVPALLLVATLVAAGAAGARLLGLADLTVWHDEAATLVRVFGHDYGEIEAVLSGARSDAGSDPRADRAAHLPSVTDLLRWQRPDPELGWDATLKALTGHPEHAPLYYLLVKLVTTLPGPVSADPLTSARGVSAVAGILLVPAVFWLARELFGRGPVPWVAGLLVAVSPMHFLYAQEARQYALWVLLVAAASAALLAALRRSADGRGTGWDAGLAWSLYGLLTLLGLYTHLLFVLILAVHGVYILLAWGAERTRPGAPVSAPPATLRPWALAVGAAGLAFLPWVAVILRHREEAAHFTAWMTRDIGWARQLGEWGTHLTRALVDLDPAPPPAWLAGLALATFGAALALYLWRAPRPARWLPVGIGLVYLGVVLGPDLILGGSRSQHVRYALPAVLAVQLVLAWVIGRGLAAPSRALRTGSAGLLAALTLLGALSVAAISRADTWWSKQFGSATPAVARLLDAGPRPLVLAGSSGVTSGELLSLAHRLRTGVSLWTEGTGSLPDLAGYAPAVALMPSPGLAERLRPHWRPVPFPRTWQWFVVEPAAGPRPTGVSERAADAAGGSAP